MWNPKFLQIKSSFPVLHNNRTTVRFTTMANTMANAKKIAEISLANARKCLEESNYGRTFAHFLLFLKLEPERSNEVYYEFALAAREWTELLEQENRIEDLFKCYEQACEIFPDHDTVLNNIGAQLFRMGYIEEAAAYIRKSLMVNPGYLAARDNLENICSHLVERWHFPMLNDKRRNFAYQFAIDKAVRSGYNTVLDIGTGTGILSLMCEHSGARQITACDRSRAMIEVAKDVLISNGVEERICLVHKSSTDMSIPTDLSNKVRLVVTETFDAGLFGEHIVSTMIHAWKHLISTSPMGTSIPCGATMYVCGLECESIRRQNRLMYPMLQYLDLSCVDVLCTTGHVAEEPYTTENLSTIKGGYKILTNIVELLRVNFTNLCELEGLNSGKSWMSDLYVKQKGRLDALAVWFDLHLDDTVTISTAANNKSCWEQAIYPVTHITRHSSTEYDTCMIKKKETLRTLFHFEQDCLRLNKCEVLHPVQVKPDKKLENPFANLNSSSSEVQSDQSSMINDVYYKHDNVCKESSLPFRKRKMEPVFCKNSMQNQSCLISSDRPSNKSDVSVRESVIRIANGNNLCSSISTDAVQIENCKSYTVNNSYPSPSCQLIMSGRRNSTDVHLGMEKCSLDAEPNIIDFIRPDCSDKKLIEYNENGNEECVIESKLTFLADEVDIGYLNDIHLNKLLCRVLEQFRTSRKDSPLTLLLVSSRLSLLAIQAKKMGYTSVVHATQEEHHGSLKQVAAVNGCKVGDITLIDVTYLRDCNIKTDVIVFDVVEPCGAFKQQVLEDITFHRETSLKIDGLLVPSNIRIMGLFIESEELDNLSHVTGNDKTLDYKIADHINVFQMLNHMNIDMSTMTHTKLSETFELFDLDLGSSSSQGEPALTSIQETVEKTVDIVNTGQISALVYWFEIKLDETTSVCTLDSRCHWKQAAVIIKGDNMVVLNGKLMTKITLQNSCLDVSVVKYNAESR